MPRETRCIICKKVVSPGYVVPDSLVAVCSECGSIVWVLPASQLIPLHNSKIRILCTKCATSELDREEYELADFTPGQLQELMNWRRYEKSREN